MGQRNLKSRMENAVKKVYFALLAMGALSGNLSFAFDTAHVCEAAMGAIDNKARTYVIQVKNNTKESKGHFFAECGKSAIPFSIMCKKSHCHRVKGDFFCRVDDGKLTVDGALD